MQNKQIRQITDGSIIVAVYLSLFLVSKLFGGLLEQFLYFIIPIPLSIYGYKYDFKKSIIVSISTLLISFILISPFTTLLYVMPCLIIGLILPIIIKKQLNNGIEVLILGLSFLMVSLLTSVFFGFVFNYNIVDDTKALAEIILSFFNSIPSAYLEAILISVIPSMIILTSFLEGVLLSIVIRILLYRLKMIDKINFLNGFSFAKTPKFIGYLYIAVFVLGIFSIINIPLKDDLFIIYSIILNIFFVFTFYICYQGLFVVAKYSKLHNKRWIYYISVFSLFIFPFVVITLGFLESILHISKKIN